jgi:hypothetical protein
MYTPAPIRHAVPRLGAGILTAFLLPAGPLPAQRTRAERTANQETSTHADVLAFLDSLARARAGIRIGTLTTSAEGRTVPFVVASRPLVDHPAAAHRSGKPIVYIQANIHAGEVEGKEASLVLLRELTLGSLRPLLDSLVLLVVPIYNADGNDFFREGGVNRPGQSGPAMVGRRSNGQGLDLNRDLVKQEAPETRGLLDLVDRWDPDLYLDLHTTNGSYHGYVLTFSAGNNPNGTPSNDHVRERFLPEVRARMRQRHRWETYWYGNFLNQEPDSLAAGWQTFEPHARYATNWFALRGRMSILSEAYSNADFATRISATHDFVLEILRLAVEQRDQIKALNRRSGEARPDSVVIRSAFAEPRQDEVIAELTERTGRGSGGFARRRRTGVYRTIRMPVYDRFVAVAKAPLRAGYLLPPQHRHLVQLLSRQGIGVGELTSGWEGEVESFRVDSVTAAANPFEGHRLVRAWGRWSSRAASALPGWFFVPTDQRLGAFAGLLLEPESEDGLVTWNQLDRDLRRGGEYPILRVVADQPAVIGNIK